MKVYKMKSKSLTFSFTCDNNIKGTADKLRGYFANNYSEYVLMHNHLDEDYLYKSPLIQYKFLDGEPFVLGINEGADILQKIHKDITCLKIGNNKYQVKDIKIVLKKDNFGISQNKFPYTFLTPWLALNERNYEKYLKVGNLAQRKRLLEKILIGNIISMSKSLGYTVPGVITANVSRIKEVQTKLKGNPMLGFLGNFSVNFSIPDYWGIGKSVSRGFGTVKRVASEEL